MPELPEVHNVCRSLAPRLLGRRVVEVRVHRASVVHGLSTPAALLEGLTLLGIRRHGKHLALVGGRVSDAHTERHGCPAGVAGEPPRQRGEERTTSWQAHALGQRRTPPVESACLDIHLGMTGSLCHHAPPYQYAPGVPVSASGGAKSSHIHLAWKLDDASWLLFRDPRRFGGVWTFPSLGDLQARRWHALGEDALTIPPRRLAARLAATQRPLKAALLDQELVAGLGNIYVDELLFACGLHPLTPANRVQATMAGTLVRGMRRILARAIAAGGSSTRDYVDGEGRLGSFQFQHKVYGRAGLACRRCGTTLEVVVVAGRTSVFCGRCQPT